MGKYGKKSLITKFDYPPDQHYISLLVDGCDI